MSKLNDVVDSVKDKAGDVADKVRKFDVKAFLEEVKGLDMGVALTKFQDATASLDVESKMQAVRDLLDSPEMDALKEKGRTVKDFMGYVPYYAQSVPTMVKEAVEKIKK